MNQNKWTLCFGTGGRIDRNTHLPEEVTFKTKLELAWDLIDEVRGGGLKNRLVLADSAFGDSYEFRQALRRRSLDYLVQVEGFSEVMDPGEKEPRSRMERGRNGVDIEDGT